MTSRQKRFDPLGRYYTPLWACVAGLNAIENYRLRSGLKLSFASVLEPGCGDGAWLSTLRSEGYAARWGVQETIGIDVDVEAPMNGADVKIFGSFTRDAELPVVPFKPARVAMTYAATGSVDLCVGNPPFELAVDFVDRGLEEADLVAYMVRQGFLSSMRRNEWFLAHRPVDVTILSRRASFGICEEHRDYLRKLAGRDDVEWGSDSADYVIAIWDRHRADKTLLHWEGE